MSNYKGGKLLNANDYRNAISILHNKFSIDWSSKVSIVRDINITNMGIMLVIPGSGNVSILIENVRCRVFDENGTELFTENATSNEIPTTIKNIQLKETDGTAITTVLVREDDNILNPYQIASDISNPNHRIYWYYTYKLLEINVTSVVPVKGIAIIHNMLDSVPAKVTLDNLTSFRWGSINASDVRQNPLLINNMEVIVNPSTLISDSLNNHSHVSVPLFSIDDFGTKTDRIDIPGEMVPTRRPNLLKIKFATTYSSTVLDFGGGLTLISLDIILLSTGYYLHEYIVAKEEVSHGGYWIYVANKGTAQGMSIELNNMVPEYDTNNFRLSSLPVRSDDDPLTNLYIATTVGAAIEEERNMAIKEFTFISRQLDLSGVNYVVGTFANKQANYADYIDYDDPTEDTVIGYYPQCYIITNNHMLLSRARYNGDLIFNGFDTTWLTEFLGADD